MRRIGLIKFRRRSGELSPDSLRAYRYTFSPKQITDPSQLKMGMQIVWINEKLGKIRIGRYIVSSGVIVDRDNKPSYILIEGNRFSRRAYLADMGIIPYLSFDALEIGWNPNNWCYWEE